MEELELLEKHLVLLEKYFSMVDWKVGKRKVWRVCKRYFFDELLLVAEYFDVEVVWGLNDHPYFRGSSKSERGACSKALKKAFDLLYKKYSPLRVGRPLKLCDFGKVHDLRKQGCSIRKIAKELGLSKSKVERVLKWKRF